MAVGKGSILRAAKAGSKKENGVEFMTQAKETVMEGMNMAEEKSAAEAMPREAEAPQTNPVNEGTVKKSSKKRTSKAVSEKASAARCVARKTQKEADAPAVKKTVPADSKKEPMTGAGSSHVGIMDQMPAYLL